MAGGVINGQYANQDTFNNAFLKKNADDETLNKISLRHPASGADVESPQAAINKLFEGIGATGETDATINDYNSNNYILDGDNRKEAIEKLDQELYDQSVDIQTIQTQVDGIQDQLDDIVVAANIRTTLGKFENLGYGDNSKTVFSTTNSINTGSAIVFRNGVEENGTFSINANDITFGVAPTELDLIEIFYFSTPYSDFILKETTISAGLGDGKTYNYTGNPKSADGLLLFNGNGRFIYKTDYTVNLTTKTIVLAEAVIDGDPPPRIYYCDVSTSVDIAQFDLGYGNGIQTTFDGITIPAFDSMSFLALINGRIASIADFAYSNSGSSVTFSSGDIPQEAQNVYGIAFVAQKGLYDEVVYKTITSDENTARTFRLNVQPYLPTKVLLDVLQATFPFLVYGVDFTIMGDTVTILATTRGNTVTTGSILRLAYKV